MSNIYDLTTKINGKGIHLFKYGYEEAPETALLLYDMFDLNNENLDFRNKKLKRVAEKVSTTESGESISWYDESLKEASVSITVRTSATAYTVSVSTIQVGEQLYNQTTGVTVVVTAVSGADITLGGSGDTGSLAGQVLQRINFAKKYGVDHSFTAARNDLQNKTNYIQFTETLIASDMIENNKTRLFVDTPEEYLKLQFTDASRKIIKGFATSFYFGVSAKTNVSGNYIYTAGGLEDYIPVAAKVNIKGGDDDATKTNLRDQLTKSYKSGVTGIRGENKLIAFCTTKFMDEIDRLYENKVVYNDKLESIKIRVSSYNVGGKKLNMTDSNILNEVMGDVAVCYIVPIDYAFIYNVPVTAADATGKSLEKTGRGIVYKKPQTTPEKSSVALFTCYSYMFGNIYSGAYRKLTIA